MNLLPKAAGSRPRLACELFPGGVVAGRSPEPGLPLGSVARAELPANAVVPSLKPGNIADRVSVIAALRRVLEAVGGRSNARNADLTLIIPDAAVRVLLLDFDTLPSKLSEALPIVRFRLKKLIPFDSDDAMVTFQIMSTSRSMIRVLAVAMPRDLLREYETAVREAGFEPGAILPSTLAALAAVDEGEGASLLVNAHSQGVTTAIVRAGIVLLHRTLELSEFAPPTPAGLPAALFETSGANGHLLPLIDRDDTHAEWAAQDPLPEHGRTPYADLAPTPAAISAPIDMYAAEAAPVSRSPYASPMVQQELDAQFHNAPYLAPSAVETLTSPESSDVPERLSTVVTDADLPVHTLAPDARDEEIARAISVAIAYFEDSLSVAPEVLLSAGPLGADNLNRILGEQGVAQEDGVRVRELISADSLAQTAVTARVPRSWLAGVTGALRS